MNKELKELLGILQEENAEVVQVVSKIERFGIDNLYKGATNKDRLVQEVGDVLAVILLISLRHPGVLDSKRLELAVSAKIEKLKKYIPELKDFDFDAALDADEKRL